MSILSLDELLAPIPGDNPCGRDLRLDPQWDKLQSLRGSDWNSERREGKWQDLKGFAAELIQKQSKDLRIASYLVEASGRLHGFTGVSESLRVARGLVENYWNAGLYPVAEGGNLELRAAALEWFNEKFADVVSSVPYIPSQNGQEGYSLGHYHQARDVVGWERSARDSNGDWIEEKRFEFTRALESGLISLDMYMAALEKVKRQPVEQLSQIFSEALAEFRAFDNALEAAFKPADPEATGIPAPSLSLARGVFEEIGSQIDAILTKKRAEEPDIVPGQAPGKTDGGSSSNNLVFTISESGSGGAWAEAEMMIKAGQIEEGLARMTRLAASETSGRARFYRKLLLAEVCLSRGRDRLARTIFEELNEQIDKYHLDEWETPQWAGTVWGRLYKIYRKTEPDSDRTHKLYKRLSSADPWQALAIPEE